MKALLKSIFAVWRALWLGGFKWLALPWRWMAALWGGPASARSTRRSSAGESKAAGKPGTPAPREPAGGAAAAAGASKASVEAASPPAPAPAPEPEPEPAAEPPAAGRAAPASAPAPAPASSGPWRPQKDASRPARRAGKFTAGVFRKEAGERAYKLYVPAGKPEGMLPLVVMLHGCKQDPDDFAAGTRMNALAEREPMLVLYPAQTRAANPYACWNWFSRLDQQADAGEPAIIAGMVREVIARHAVDPRRVYVAGLSAGGAMAAILAHTHPDLFAAVGVHSGVAFGVAQDVVTALGVMKRGPGPRAERDRADSSATPAVPLIAFHGDHDTTVHPLNGERVVEQALEVVAGGATSAPGVAEHGQVPGGRAYTRTVYRPGKANPRATVEHVVEHWLVHGSGHAWSGGDSKGSFTDPQGPDASAEMLRFFLAHRLPLSA